ncbi:hypothetical protein HDU76_009618 [Blyttiomyces sp. JEL0837]|nr:hypothetical protein HDU76_009618 [Blyttiomyces sp. JEL0837]
MEMLKPIMDPLDRRNSPQEAEVLRLVTAASRIPSKVNPELKKRVTAGFGEEGLQMVACISAFFGWTNAITDSVGMELGVNDILFATQQIGPSGWRAGRHATDGFIRDPTNPDLTPTQIQQTLKDEVIPRKGLSRLTDYNQILKTIHQAEKQEQSWATQIPSSHRLLDDWLSRHLGFIPAYISALKNLEAKRAVCLMVWLFLVRGKDDVEDPCVEGEVCEWSSGAKALMFYVYTTCTGNLLLRGHAAYLATRNKVPINILVGASAGASVKNPRLDCALDFIRAAASLKRTFPASLNHRLLATMVSAKGVMELVSSLGLFNMLHRLSAIVAPEPVCFEKEVKEFLGTFSMVLNMDPEDASPQDKEERKVLDPLQFLY